LILTQNKISPLFLAYHANDLTINIIM